MIVVSTLVTRNVTEAKEIYVDISVRLTEEFNILRKIVISNETSVFQQTQDNADVSSKWVHELMDRKRKGDFQI